MADKSKKKTVKKDVYELVTNQIIEQLETGIIPWEKPWGGVLTGAFNRISKKPYSLINQYLLGKEGEWATYKQWEALGGQVKKGEKAKFVVFWKVLQKPALNEDGSLMFDENGMPLIKGIPVLRHYSVFHISQVDGVEPLPEEERPEFIDNKDGDDLIQAYGERENLPIEIERSDRAYYSPSRDRIVIPEKSQYNDSCEFYSTAFHEMVHSTGHKKRLARKEVMEHHLFGDHSYSKEELTAEMGASFLMSRLGIETKKTLKNSAGYIQSWLRELKNDKKLIVSAAGRAEKATKYILGEEVVS